MQAFPDLEPAVCELREDGRLIALLPLYRRGKTLHLAGVLHLDYLDLAAVSDEAAVDLLVEAIELEGAGGNAFAFAKVAEHSRLHAALRHPRVREAASVQSRYWSACPAARLVIPQGGTIEGALAAKRRKDHRSSGRRLREELPRHVVEHLQGDDLSEAKLVDAARLHQANQYRKAGESVFADPRFLAFLRRQAEAGAPLLLSFLRESEGGEAVAFTLGYFAGHTYYYYLTAYEGSRAHFSPGRWLLVETLRECSRLSGSNTLRLDLLSGEEAYKSRWATTFYEVNRCLVIPRSLANLPRVAAYFTIYGLKSLKNRVRGRLVGDRLAGLEREGPVLAG